MQSDPTDDSPKISSPNQHPKIPSTTLQHGLQHHDAAAPVDSHGGAHHGTIAELSPDNGVGNAEPRFAGTDRYRNNNDRNSSRLSADGNQNKARRILYDGSVDFGPTPGDKVSHDGGLETGYEARILHVTDLPNGMCALIREPVQS
jgi:hypothetical protein